MSCIFQLSVYHWHGDKSRYYRHADPIKTHSEGIPVRGPQTGGRRAGCSPGAAYWGLLLCDLMWQPLALTGCHYLTFNIYHIFVFSSNFSIKNAIFKTLTRVSKHEHEHWEHCLRTQFIKLKVLEQLTSAVACSASHGDPHVWVECMLFSWAM